MKNEFAGHIIKTNIGDVFVYPENIEEYEYDSVKLNYNIIGEIEVDQEVINQMSKDISDTDNSEIKIGIISDIEDITSGDAYDVIIDDFNDIIVDNFEDEDYDDDYEYYDDEDDLY